MNKEGEVNLTTEGITEVNSVILGQNVQGKGLVGSGFNEYMCLRGTEVVLAAVLTKLWWNTPSNCFFARNN